jgi:hypothetical protein
VAEDLHQGVAVGGAAFGHQQRHGDQGRVGEALAAIGLVEAAVLLQEPEEQGRADALVAVDEGVVLDQEVEEVCRLLGQARVDLLAAGSLVYRGQRTPQAVILLAAEELARSALAAQVLDQAPGLVVGDGQGGCGGRPGRAHPLVVVVVEQIEGIGVVGHHA